jgi:TolB protein
MTMRMASLFRIYVCAALLVASLISPLAHAQLRVEISGVGGIQIPIAVAVFADESVAPQRISAIIRADLERSGMFKIISTGATLSELSKIDFADWRSRGADALVVGSVQRLPGGQFSVKYALFDTVRGVPLSVFSLAAQAQTTRLTAHKVADDVYEKLTGIKGIFSTRIAYVTKDGRSYRLEVADEDGEDVQVALRSSEPIISPSWSPDGTKVAYVSFEAKKPVVYVQNLISGKRTLIANHKGNNSAPAWSPDGTKIALALSRDGITQIYMADAEGHDVRQLTTTDSINTEPRFSADGRAIYFTSDRSGEPQIYRMDLEGMNEQRVTFNGNYSISPRVSPDGKLLAYISRRDGGFYLYTLDLTNGQELRLSDSAKDESPSFSANSKYIMFATESGRRGTLSVVSVDGRTRHRLTPRAGDIREPTWGPFMK